MYPDPFLPASPTDTGRVLFAVSQAHCTAEAGGIQVSIATKAISMAPSFSATRPGLTQEYVD